MFQNPLVKTITISRKVFSAFSAFIHLIKDTDCPEFSNLNYKLSILLVFYLTKILHLKKSDVGLLYTAFPQILKAPSNIYKINPHILLVLVSVVETI